MNFRKGQKLLYAKTEATLNTKTEKRLEIRSLQDSYQKPNHFWKKLFIVDMQKSTQNTAVY